MKRTALVLLTLFAVIALPLSAAGNNYVGVTGSFPLSFSSDSHSSELLGTKTTSITRYMDEAMNFGVEGQLMLSRTVGIAGFVEYSKPYQEKITTTITTTSRNGDPKKTTNTQTISYTGENPAYSGLTAFGGLSFPVKNRKNTWITAGIHVNQVTATTRNNNGEVTAKTTSTDAGLGASFRFNIVANPLYLTYSADVFYDFMDPSDSEQTVSKLIVTPVRLSIGKKF